MKKVLHIVASPRGMSSRTLRIADALIKKIRKQFPSAAIDTLDVFAEKLPEMNITRVKGKYMLMSGQELSGDAVAAWEEIKAHIARFLAADIIIISTPMWNFGIPYRLKHYIDVVWQPGFIFKYTENGPVGLAAGRKVFVVSTRGGDYSAGTPAEPYDQITPYLKTVLGWAGITDLTFISGQPMDANTEDGREAKIKEAIARIDSLNLA
ncbi:MAG TPA: NAD(P)H-dependent oxidoreductase [Candidatus Rifleibacterium sp.]|nr:NAD(P)H-dependent oxidoreductase [Candidatus Rifleibacterium sp.]